MHQKTRLFLELDSEADPSVGEGQSERALADGWVIGPECAARVEAGAEIHGEGCWVMMRIEPQAAGTQWARGDTVWVGESNLEVAARRRDRWPELRWVPRAEVFRPVARFDFRPQYHGEGFKTYVPDLTSYRRFQVAGEGLEIGEWLRRAQRLGFSCVWLHGTDAAARGRGLNLDMLERARRVWAGELWISGGATALAHLQNLVDADGPEAVVVPEGFARRCGVKALRRALTPRLAVALQQSSAGNSCARQAPVSSRCPGSPAEA